MTTRYFTDELEAVKTERETEGLRILHAAAVDARVQAAEADVLHAGHRVRYREAGTRTIRHCHASLRLKSRKDHGAGQLAPSMT